MAIQSKDTTDKNGRQYHIQCKKGDIGKYVILPGDPFRTDKIAKYFEEIIFATIRTQKHEIGQASTCPIPSI